MNVQEATAKALLVDADGAGGGTGRRVTCSARTRSSWTPTTPTCGRSSRRCATGMGLDPDPMARLRALGLSRRDRGRARRRPAGRVGRMTIRTRRPRTPRPSSARCIERSNRLGADPRNTNYAGGNTSAKGTGHRPGDRHARRAAVGQGLRRRPRHADRGRAWPCCGSTGCARSSTSTRASSARTRWSPPSTTACTAGAARRRRSTPRCTASSTRPTSTTSTPTRASRWRPPPTARR